MTRLTGLTTNLSPARFPKPGFRKTLGRAFSGRATSRSAGSTWRSCPEGTAETRLRIGPQPYLRDLGGEWTAACPTVEKAAYCQPSLAGLCSLALPPEKAQTRVAEPQSAQWSLVGIENASPPHPANRWVESILWGHDRSPLTSTARCRIIMAENRSEEEVLVPNPGREPHER